MDESLCVAAKRPPRLIAVSAPQVARCRQYAVEGTGASARIGQTRSGSLHLNALEAIFASGVGLLKDGPLSRCVAATRSVVLDQDDPRSERSTRGLGRGVHAG